MEQNSTKESFDDPGAGSLLLRDLPSDTAGDAFGHADYARALAELLRTAQAPLTVGVFGPWGRGKSTVLNGLSHELRALGVPYVGFDVWRHEGQALRRHFLKAVADGLVGSGALNERTARHQLGGLDADVADVKPTLHVSWWRLLRAAAAALVLLLLFLVSRSWIADLSFEVAFIDNPWGAITAAFALTTLLLTLLSQAFADAQTSTTLKRLDEPDRFTDAFVGLLASATDNSRVVIAIDNLDRCSPEHALATLGIVKTYLEPAARRDDVSSGADAIFVIATDHDALRRHLTQTSSFASAEDAEEYLRKFFAVTVTVTDLLDDDMREFARAQLDPVLTYWHRRAEAVGETSSARAADLVVFTVGRNPRRIKQLINDFNARMQLIVERERPLHGGGGAGRISPPISPYGELVLTLMLLEVLAPELIDLLREAPDRFSSWQQLAAAESVPGTAGSVDPDAVAQPLPPQSDWARVAEFLRRCSALPSGLDVRPFITLKQTQLELRLPQLAELVARLDNRQDRTADVLLERVGKALGAELIAEFGQIVERERLAGYAEAAVERLRRLLLLPEARSAHRAATSRLLAENAAKGGRFEEVLFTLAPSLQLELFDALEPHAVGAWAEMLVRQLPNAQAPARKALLSAVAKRFDKLPERARTPFAQGAMTASGMWPTDVYDELLLAHPQLLAPAAGNLLLWRLSELSRVAEGLQPEESSSWLQRFSIVTTLFAQWNDGTHESPTRRQLIDTLSTLAAAYTENSEDAMGVTRPLIDALDMVLHAFRNDVPQNWEVDTGWTSTLRGAGLMDAVEYAETARAISPPMRELLRTTLSAILNLNVSDPLKHRARRWLERQ